MDSTQNTYKYVIDGVTISTNRELPEKVRRYIAQWANDPCWDIDNLGDGAGDAEIGEYASELRAYAAAYETTKSAEYEQRIANVTDMRAIKIAFLRGDHAEAHARAAIAQAEQLKRIADALYSDTHDRKTGEVVGKTSVSDSVYGIAMAMPL